MTEAGLYVLGSDGGQGLGDALFKSGQRSGFSRAEQLLDLGPALLDGIQVRRVGRLSSSNAAAPGRCPS